MNKEKEKNKVMLRVFAWITALGSYVMLLMGAIVTKTGAGKGCGNSWPFCHGQLIPASLPIDTVIEYSHRVVSGGVGFLILILALWSYIAFRKDRKVRLLAGMSLFFVVLQGGLGALTVVFTGVFAKKAALALHFGFSLIAFASVVLLAFHLHCPKVQRLGVSRRARSVTWGLMVYTYVVVYTGALVRHTQATMACGYHFPFCGEVYLPNFSSLPGIHMLHRFSSITLWVSVLCFYIWILRHYREQKEMVRGSCIAFILITLQVVSGITTVLLGGKLLIALLHTTLISFFFVALAFVCMQVGLPWKGDAKDGNT